MAAEDNCLCSWPGQSVTCHLGGSLRGEGGGGAQGKDSERGQNSGELSSVISGNEGTATRGSELGFWHLSSLRGERERKGRPVK